MPNFPPAICRFPHTSSPRPLNPLSSTIINKSVSQLSSAQLKLVNQNWSMITQPIKSSIIWVAQSTVRRCLLTGPGIKPSLWAGFNVLRVIFTWLKILHPSFRPKARHHSLILVMRSCRIYHQVWLLRQESIPFSIRQISHPFFLS